ncbi:hypothetical protein L914_13096, partial [Phytophthora nicotianae]
TAKLGLIAQDSLKVCSEIVNYSPNENLEKVDEDDVEGFQYNIDYNQLAVLNCVVIKALIKKSKN